MTNLIERHFAKVLVAIIGIFLIFAILTEEGVAANSPHPTLDAIASEVAGKPVAVHCETDVDFWQAMVRAAFEPDPNSGQVAGFTQLQHPVVYLAPRICYTLHDALRSGVEDAGFAPFALALHTLAHEGVHQRGIRDEGETECTSLPLVRGLAVKYFNVPESINETRVVNKLRTFKVRVLGKPATLRLRVPTKVTVSVPNPVLSRIHGWAVAWHRAKPPAYQGNC